MAARVTLLARALPFALAAIYLAVALRVISDYGPTFDAVLGDYAYGEYLWNYLTTGDRTWLLFDPGRIPAFGSGDHPDWQLTYPLKWVYPVPAILSAVSCDFLAGRLHWLHPIDAHHLICPLSFAGVLVVVHRFVARRIGSLAATITTLSTALHPHLFGHSLNDIKDMPTLFVVYAAVAVYARALESGRARWLVWGAALTGVGLATKVNAIWPAALFSVVWVVTRMRPVFAAPESRRRWLLAIGVAPFVLAAAYLACSPQLRVDGVARFVEHWRYALFESTRVIGRDSFSLEPLRNLAWTSPLPLLPLAIVGIVLEWRRRSFERPTFALLLLLLVVPLLRPCLPGMRYFNLTRHFLEVIPVLAIFSGITVATVLRWVANHLSSAKARVTLVAVALGALFAPQALALWRAHPWQTAWFNALPGGLAGAQARHVADADDYWCHSSRTTVRWLNEHADRGAVIVDPFAPWMIQALAKTELRADLAFVPTNEGVELLVGNGLLDPARDRGKWSAAPVVIVTYVPQTRRFNQPEGARTAILRHCETNLSPWHVLRARDGGEIVRFYRIETTN